MSEVTVDELKALVYKVLCGQPLLVYDEEYQVVKENTKWELVEPRRADSDGRKIGSGNILAAYNLLQHRLITTSNKNADSAMLFEEVLRRLENEKLIRVIPEVARQEFYIVGDDE